MAIRSRKYSKASAESTFTEGKHEERPQAQAKTAPARQAAGQGSLLENHQVQALSYNARSGHVKRGGAVVGRLEDGVFACYLCRTDIDADLPKVRRHMEEWHG